MSKAAVTQFLTTIVPNQDLLCIAHSRDIPAKGRAKKGWTQRFFTPEQAANGALVDHLSELNQHQDTNVYFGVAAFNKRKRERVNVTKLKCLLLDVDLKGDRPHYKTKHAAVHGLMQLWQAVPCLPKPWIIDSGNGIHAYFVFEEAVDMKLWHVAANTFAKVAEDVDARLLADPKPTKDAARVMRVPDSWNAKQARREHVKVLGIGELGKFQDIKDGLAAEAATRNVWVADLVPDNTPLVPSAAPTHAVGAASSLSGGFVDNSEDFTGLNLVPIAQGCKQMNRMLNSKGDVPEPDWLLMMRVLNTCDKAETLVHTFSNGHPGYNKAETNRKLQHIRTAFGAPSATCDEFAQSNPKGCKGCRFKDRVWTPSQLGLFEQQKKEKEVQTVAASKKLAEGSKTESGYLPLPAYYNQTRIAATHAPVTTLPVWKGEDKGEVHMPIIAGHINVVGSSRRVDINARGQVTTSEMMIHLDVVVWNEHLKVAIPSKVLTSSTIDKATETLRDMGMLFTTKSPPELSALRLFFNDVVAVAGHRPVPYYHTKGWSPRGLTVGAVHLSPNKKAVEGYTYGEHKRRNDRSTEKFCSGRPVGMEGKWKQALSVFDGDNPHAHIVLLSGMANVLLPLNSGMQGGIVLALTGKSGKGKTTLMYFMNSFLGHPKEGIVQGTSTDKAMLDMLKQSSVFLLPVDDMTSMSAQNLSSLLSTVTSGRPRQRLERQEGGDWDISESDTINASLLLTSNFSASAAFMAGKRSDNQLQLEAAMTRQLEIPAYSTFIDNISGQRWDRANDLILEHHGHALRPFCQYLVDNKELVRQRMSSRKAAFSRALEHKLGGRVTGQYRYWVRYLAAITVTAEILKELGFIKWNVNNIIQTGIELAVAQRGQTEEVQGSDMDALWDMLTDDDQGRININLSELRATDDGHWPPWHDVMADSSRARSRTWVKKGSSGMFASITNRIVNAPQWRVIATEVERNGKLDSVERVVIIPIRRLRGLVLGKGATLASSSWEEMYEALLMAGAKVVGVRADNPNRHDGTTRGRVAQTENGGGYPVAVVKIIFPPRGM